MNYIKDDVIEYTMKQINILEHLNGDVRYIFGMPPAMYWPITHSDVKSVVGMSKKLSEHPNIIDMGCGNCAISSLIYNEGGVNVVGFDPIKYPVHDSVKFHIVHATARNIPHYFYPELFEDVERALGDIEGKLATETIDYMQNYFIEKSSEFLSREERVDVAILSWPPRGLNPMLYVPFINPKVVVLAGPPKISGAYITLVDSDDPKEVLLSDLNDDDVKKHYANEFGNFFNTFSTLGIYDIVSASYTPTWIKLYNHFYGKSGGEERQIVAVLKKKGVEIDLPCVSALKYPWDEFSSNGIHLKK